MTGSARQSYYEIALTNRQVLTVFIVLLVAVLAAFLSGIWVGKRGSAQVETAEAQSIEAVEEPGSEPIARLDFFSRDGEPEAETAERPAGPPVESEGETPVTTAAVERPAGPPVESEGETPVTTAAVEPPAEAAPADEPTEPSPPAETRVAEAPEPEAPAAPVGTLVVQVFSSSNQVQAQSVVDKLRSGGYPALLSPVEVSGRTMYRVRIGPYADRQVAEGIAEQVRREFRLETWITE